MSIRIKSNKPASPVIPPTPIHSQKIPLQGTQSTVSFSESNVLPKYTNVITPIVSPSAPPSPRKPYVEQLSNSRVSSINSPVPSPSKSYAELSINNVDDILLKHNYCVLGKVIVKDNNTDEDKIKYVRASNIYGQRVLIKVSNDTHGIVSSNDRSFMYREDVRITDNTSVKNAAFQCSTPLTGVALEGKRCISTMMTNDPTNEPKESIFLIVEEAATKIVTEEVDGIMMAYPIITLAEIEANPQAVLEATSVVSSRIVNDMYKTVEAKLNEFQNVATGLKNNVEYLAKIRIEYISKLDQSFKNIRGLLTCALEDRNKPGSLKNIDDLLYNLAIKQEAIQQFILLAEGIAVDIDNVSQTCEKVACLNNLINNTMQDVNIIKSR